MILKSLIEDKKDNTNQEVNIHQDINKFFANDKAKEFKVDKKKAKLIIEW